MDSAEPELESSLDATWVIVDADNSEGRLDAEKISKED